MAMVVCERGHRYDSDYANTCPQCKEMRRTIPLVPDMAYAVDDIPDTVPLRDGMEYDGLDQFWAGMPAKEKAYPKTMVVNYGGDGSARAVKNYPLAGWLVCEKGPEKGKDYRIHEQRNFIGRSREMDICIEDPTVSARQHAAIVYDPRGKHFYVQPGTGNNLIYHNDEPVLSPAKIQQGDRLQIGKGIFLFVPLCGEAFQWEE